MSRTVFVEARQPRATAVRSSSTGLQSGDLSDRAANSPATSRAARLQARSDGAALQGVFKRIAKWARRKAAGNQRRQAERRARQGGEEHRILLDASFESELGSDELDREEEASTGHDISGDVSSSSEEGLLDFESEAEENVPAAKWQRDVTTGATPARNFILSARKFHAKFKIVKPSEWGGDDFDTLREKLEDEMAVLRARGGHEEHDRAGLLANAEPVGTMAEHDLEESGAPEDEDADAARERLQKIILKVNRRLGRIPEEHREFAMMALVLAQREIDSLLQQHKGWLSTIRSMGAGGPAGYLEDKILPVILGHMAAHVKELIPMGTGRKARDKAAGVGEGLLDIGWNAASLGVEALTFGAASAGTSAVGATYKMGFAGSGAKRSGASDRKAVAQAVVTFVLEFLQGLIPFAGSALGITGGARGIYKTVDPRKRAVLRKGYATLRDEDDLPDVQSILEARIERCEQLLDWGATVARSAKVAEHMVLLQDDLTWLQRQRQKYDKRR